ncbi:MAG: hypothetical protein ABEL76_15005, partial [Bradymonadaceae bacterium]
GESVTHAIRHRVKGEGTERGRVELVDADALKADNRRHFTFRPNRRVRALLVNGDPSSVPYRDELFFLSRAVQSDDRDDNRIVPTMITPDGLGGRDLSTYDVVLLANVARLTKSVVEQLKRFTRNGGGLFLAVGDQVEPDAYNQKFADMLPKPMRRVKLLAERGEPNAQVKATQLGSVDRDHPIFRAFSGSGGQSLYSVTLYRYMLLEPSPAERARVLASNKDGAPLLLERDAGRGRVLLLTTTLDRDWTDFPIQPAYVPFVRRTLLYLARRATSQEDRDRLVGTTVGLNVGDRVEDRAIVVGPDGERRALEPTDGTVSFVPRRAGAYEVWADETKNADRNRLDRLSFSVNVPTSESNLRTLPDDALEPWLADDAGDEGGEKSKTATRDRKRVNIWPTLLFIVALALLGETVVGTRRSVLKRLWRRVTLQTEPSVDV